MIDTNLFKGTHDVFPALKVSYPSVIGANKLFHIVSKDGNNTLQISAESLLCP